MNTEKSNCRLSLDRILSLIVFFTVFLTSSWPVAAQTDEKAVELNLADLKSKYQNCVVKIEFTLITNLEETKFNPTKSEDYYADDEPPHGSGFFVSEAEILTNAHVVETARRGSIRIKSPATGNVEFKPVVVGIGGTETIDLALLRLPDDEVLRFKKRSGLEAIPSLEFDDSDLVKQADEIAIFGYPESSNELKIIQGEVTGRQYLKMDFDKFICGHQFIEVGPAGVVQPGNSGGPALNADGNVIGLPSRGGWNQGWLIPANVATQFLRQIKESDAGRLPIRYPKMGWRLTENFAGTSVWAGGDEDMVTFELGVVVREVITGSLADDWGIKANDIIFGWANKEQGISCALDFKGYRVVTGEMKHWPPSNPTTETEENEDPELKKLHLNELIMMSNPGDEVTLWVLRKGKTPETITRRIEYKEPVELEHLGAFEKPDYEQWGDFIAQDFNDYSCNLFAVPPAEVIKGGALVTYVEPNSLAARRGMELQSRDLFGFQYFFGFETTAKWVIIYTVNGKPVKNLSQLRAALRKAESAFDFKKSSSAYDPATKLIMKERYVQIGFRTNTPDGRVLHLTPGFPIDEALEYRKAVQ